MREGFGTICSPWNAWWMPQELKGNIRVFCRVRPLLEDEDVEESAVVQYPSSTELQGRAIELNQPSGRVRSFSFEAPTYSPMII